MCTQKLKTIKCADCPKSVTSPGGLKKRCNSCHRRHKSAYYSSYYKKHKPKLIREDISIDWLNMQD